MTKIPNLKYDQVGNLYGLRNWVEYGLKQTKNELGWADFRLIKLSETVTSPAGLQNRA